MQVEVKNEDAAERMRAHLRSHMQETMGVSDASGLELLILVRMVNNLYDNAGAPKNGAEEMSGPRWALLIRLLGEEKHGNKNAVTPTYLSRCQNVSKNTMSSLIRGLEEQGLVARKLDPVDKRIFHIGLTPEGRRLVEEVGKEHLERLNWLVEGLSEAEKEELSGLLSKLHRSIAERMG
jgi:DNA-binding MarR family transcriptional regulator